MLLAASAPIYNELLSLYTRRSTQEKENLDNSSRRKFPAENISVGNYKLSYAPEHAGFADILSCDISTSHSALIFMRQVRNQCHGA